MPEHYQKPTGKSSGLQRPTKYQHRKGSNSFIPVFYEGVNGRKGLLGHDKNKSFLASRLCIQSLKPLHSKQLFFKERGRSLTLSEAGDLQAKASQQAEMIR